VVNIQGVVHLSPDLASQSAKPPYLSLAMTFYY